MESGLPGRAIIDAGDVLAEAANLTDAEPKMSEVGMNAVGNAFLDAYELAFSGATIVKLKGKPTK